MGVTNFEYSVNTAALAMKENTDCHVIIKRLNTGRYKYEARFKLENGRMNIYVLKDDMSGRLVAIIGIDRISLHGMEYDCSKGYIPQSLIKEILRFYKALDLKLSMK